MTSKRFYFISILAYVYNFSTSSNARSAGHLVRRIILNFNNVIEFWTFRVDKRLIRPSNFIRNPIKYISEKPRL